MTRPADAARAGGRARLIPLDAREDWDRALDGIPHAFAHSWENCRAMARASGHATYLFACDGPGARAVCPIAERPIGDRVDVVTPYGFSGLTADGEAADGEAPDVPALWRQVAAARGWVCGYVLSHPLFYRPDLQAPGDVCRRIETYVLDLRGSEDALEAALSPNRRRQLRAWEAAGRPLTADRAAIVEFILAEQARFFAERRAAATYAFGDAMWRDLLAQPHVVALGALQGGRLVAASIFGYTPFAGEYLFNVSRPDGQPFSAALLWEGALLLKRLGVPALHLGGGVRPGDGVARFKQRFGPAVTTAMGVCQVFDEPEYRRRCADRGVRPDETADYFPPYRALERRAPGAPGHASAHVR